MIYEEFARDGALERLRVARAFLLDMDGTFYLGERLLIGSLAFLDKLRETDRRALFLTNNSSRSASAYRTKLTRMGVGCDFANVYTSGDAAARVLRERFFGKRVYAVATREYLAELAQDGVSLTDGDDAEVLLLSYDTELTYAKLCRACHMVRAGKPYIATHPDVNCPSESGSLPDIGSFIALIESSTGRSPDMVIGKPERGIVDNALASVGADVGEACVVGDRLYTDIAAGRNAGALSVCVLTGEATLDDIRASLVKPDLVFDRLSDMIGFM